MPTGTLVGMEGSSPLTVTAVGCRPKVITLQEWDAEYAGREEAYELVDGIPVMTPGEALGNTYAGSLLWRLLTARLPSGWIAAQQMSIHIGERQRRHTVRIPDLTVVPSGLDRTTARVRPGQVALVVEVISPSSIERDWITKRAEYAAAGIPAYLVIDVRELDNVSLTLFEDPRDGAYPDVPADAPLDVVTVHIDGVGIPIRAADLID